MRNIKRKTIKESSIVELSANINWSEEYERMLLDEAKSEAEWDENVSHSLSSLDESTVKRASDRKAQDRSYTDGSIVFNGYDFFIEYMPCKGNSLQLFSDKVPIER